MIGSQVIARLLAISRKWSCDYMRLVVSNRKMTFYCSLVDRTIVCDQSQVIVRLVATDRTITCDWSHDWLRLVARLPFLVWPQNTNRAIRCDDLRFLIATNLNRSQVKSDRPFRTFLPSLETLNCLLEEVLSAHFFS